MGCSRRRSERRSCAGERAAVELDRALVRPVEPEQQAPERRLAAARLADEREHLAFAHLDVDAVDGSQVRAAEQAAAREATVHVAGLEQRRHARAP